MNQSQNISLEKMNFNKAMIQSFLIKNQNVAGRDHQRNINR